MFDSLYFKYQKKKRFKKLTVIKAGKHLGPASKESEPKIHFNASHSYFLRRGKEGGGEEGVFIGVNGSSV